MRASGAARALVACVFLVATICGAASDEVEAGRRRVDGFLRGLEGLEAQFEQVLTDRSGRIIDEARGSLAVKRPDRFRWDYREPYEQVIVADGARVWLYDRDLEQVTVRRLDGALSATPASLLSGVGELEDNFSVTRVEREGDVEWVRMEPKRSDTDFKWVRLGFAGAQLRYMQLGDKLGQTTRLEFSEVERNPPLDPGRFTFTPPPGADVIGDSSDVERPAKP